MPGAGHAIREWPAESFGRLARHLYEKQRLHIVVAGLARDAEKAQRIREVSGLDVAIFINLGVAQLVALIARAEIVVVNDSAGIHLAAALGRRGVAISMGMSLVDFHPYPPGFGAPVRFVYPPFLREAPSLEDALVRFKTSPKVPASDVEVEVVMEAVDSALREMPVP